MDNNDKKATSVGISFTGLLAILFITLKLLKVITWSWLWVLAPLWVPAAGLILFGLAALVIVLRQAKKIKRR